MKRSVLLLKLKKDIEKYRSKVKHIESCFDGYNKSLELAMSKYNLENFYEIINSSVEGLNDEINREELKNLKNDIDYYFSLYALEDEEFREFIKIITIYLIFITKKPLHPSGTEFSKGITVYKKKDIYYCTGKTMFIRDKHSLCKYCIAR